MKTNKNENKQTSTEVDETNKVEILMKNGQLIEVNPNTNLIWVWSSANKEEIISLSHMNSLQTKTYSRGVN